MSWIIAYTATAAAVGVILWVLLASAFAADELVTYLDAGWVLLALGACLAGIMLGWVLHR